jgi:hypothetical protein
MFELALAQLTHADREREIEAALRRRQLLKSPTEGAESSRPSTVTTSSPRRAPVRLPTAGR